ncbi:MAG: flavodoxin family protein [Candidatus Aerophobetes bacterium]|nr:flavodoxin family protein [Candidatus Aerophobetes bacterium]
MTKVLIIYYSRSGNTEKMAHLVEKGVREEKVEVKSKRVKDINLDELLEAEGIILGSPTYFGSMASSLKKLIDESVKYYGKFKGKVGGAFTSCQRVGGGGETTLQSIINAFLIHGMIVQGEVEGHHYGPVAVGAPDKIVSEECKNLGKKVARMVKRLFS